MVWILQRFSRPLLIAARNSTLAFLVSLGAAMVAAASPIDGDNQFYSKTWTADDGLSHNIVMHVVQDSVGYLWIGTAGGLSRFDGVQFKNFRLPAEMAKKGYNIRGLAEDRTGLLLLLPNDTIVSFDGQTFRPHPAMADLPSGILTELFAEGNGVLWVGTRDGDLFRWENHHVQIFNRAELDDRRIAHFSFAQDGEGETWIATGDFLGRYRKGKIERFSGPFGHIIMIGPRRAGGIWIFSDSRLFQLEHDAVTEIISTPERLPPNAFPHALRESSDGAVWIATTGRGLYRFKNGRIDHIENLSDSTTCVAPDQEGNVWAGTNGQGLGIVRPKHYFLYSVPLTSGPYVCRSVAESKDGAVWIVDRRGGVSKFDGREFRPVTKVAQIFVNGLCGDGEGGFWLGARDGLYQLPNNPDEAPKKLDAPLKEVRTLFRSRDGTLWFSDESRALGRVRNGAAQLFSRVDGYAELSVRCFAEDGENRVWAGTDAGALLHFAEGRWSRVDFPPDFPVVPIHTLVSDRLGALWIGTSDGLLVYHHGTFRRFTEDDGLSDSMVLQLVTDSADNLWLGSRRGLYYIDRQITADLAEGKVQRIHATRLLGKDEGLPDISLRAEGQPSALSDHDGVLWLATDQGALAVDATNLSAPRAKAAPLLIEEVQIDGVLKSLDHLRVPPGQHRVGLRFALLSYSTPQKFRLRFKLGGIDPEWIESDATRTTTYSSLPPGNYQFRVIEENLEGAEVAAAALDFEVLPFWWQRSWVRATGILILVTLAALLAQQWSQRRLRRALEEAERAYALARERARISRDLHDELGGSAAKIVFLVDRIKRERVGSISAHLVQQLDQRVRRHARDLRRVVWSVNPKNNNLERLVAFIDRFTKSFFDESGLRAIVVPPASSLRNSVPPDVQHHLLSIINEAFTNILRHARASNVTVKIHCEATSLVIEISDDGAGFDLGPPRGEEHLGLANMQSRMAELEGEMTLISAPGEGTRLILRTGLGKPGPVSQI